MAGPSFFDLIASAERAEYRAPRLARARMRCSCGMSFEAGVSPAYGRLALRGERANTPAVVDAFVDPTWAELGSILDALPSAGSFNEHERGRLFQRVYGAACDPATDGTRARIGRAPRCPACGSRAGAWQSLEGAYGGETFVLTHASWEAMSLEAKRARIESEVAAWLESEVEE